MNKKNENKENKSMKLIDKLKKAYKEHRIFVILMGVVIICVVLMLIMLLKYFYFGSTDKLRTRTCVDIKEGAQKEFNTKLQEDESITDSTLRVSDKSNIVYITIEFNESIALADAQSKAVASLENLNEEARQCYDIQFILTQAKAENNEGFHIMGAANANGTSVKWNNNKAIEATE